MSNLNITYQESFEYVNEILIEEGIKPLSINEFKDWGVQEGATYSYLDSLIRDFVSEMQSEKAANNHYNKYGY
jgi:hypothetical protein